MRLLLDILTILVLGVLVIIAGCILCYGLYLMFASVGGAK